MSNQMMIVFIIGWIFLFAGAIWPNNKWGGRAIKFLLNGISLGLFVANAIYQFVR